MRMSGAGIYLTSSFESWSATPYKDSGGLWTIGYGHLIRPNESYLLTANLDQATGSKLLANDVRLAEMCVSDNLGSTTLTQYQFDALVDFTFNVGCRNFRTSTLFSRIKKSDLQAADDFLIWNKDESGKTRQGLIRRRAVEWLMYSGKEVDLV